MCLLVRLCVIWLVVWSGQHHQQQQQQHRRRRQQFDAFLHFQFGRVSSGNAQGRLGIEGHQWRHEFERGLGQGGTAAEEKEEKEEEKEERWRR